MVTFGERQPKRRPLVLIMPKISGCIKKTFKLRHLQLKKEIKIKTINCFLSV